MLLSTTDWCWDTIVFLVSDKERLYPRTRYRTLRTGKRKGAITKALKAHYFIERDVNSFTPTGSLDSLCCDCAEAGEMGTCLQNSDLGTDIQPACAAVTLRTCECKMLLLSPVCCEHVEGGGILGRVLGDGLLQIFSYFPFSLPTRLPRWLTRSLGFFGFVSKTPNVGTPHPASSSPLYGLTF